MILTIQHCNKFLNTRHLIAIKDAENEIDRLNSSLKYECRMTSYTAETRKKERELNYVMPSFSVCKSQALTAEVIKLHIPLHIVNIIPEKILFKSIQIKKSNHIT